MQIVLDALNVKK